MPIRVEIYFLVFYDLVMKSQKEYIIFLYFNTSLFDTLKTAQLVCHSAQKICNTQILLLISRLLLYMHGIFCSARLPSSGQLYSKSDLIIEKKAHSYTYAFGTQTQKTNLDRSLYKVTVLKIPMLPAGKEIPEKAGKVY